MRVGKIIIFTLTIIFILVLFTCYKRSDDISNIAIVNADNINEFIVDNSLSISENVKENKILKRYEKFNSIIYNNSYSLPLEDGRIPQGVTIVDKYIFITGYYENKNKSDIVIIDLEGNFVNKVKLDTNSHVGSIAYDSINNLIWIPGNNGRLLAYNKDDFLNNKEVHNIINIDYVKDRLYDYKYSNKYNIAFLTVDNEYIYLGSFNQHKKCLVKKYFINNSDGIKLEYVNEFNMPSRVQGLSIYHDNNKTYLVTSNSYNRYEKSQFKIYEYDDSIKDYSNMSIKRYTIPPMSEQISVKNGYGFLIFESGATKYKDAKDKVKDIIIIDMNKALE